MKRKRGHAHGRERSSEHPITRTRDERKFDITPVRQVHSPQNIVKWAVSSWANKTPPMASVDRVLGAAPGAKVYSRLGGGAISLTGNAIMPKASDRFGAGLTLRGCAGAVLSWVAGRRPAAQDACASSRVRARVLRIIVI